MFFAGPVRDRTAHSRISLFRYVPRRADTTRIPSAVRRKPFGGRVRDGRFTFVRLLPVSMSYPCTRYGPYARAVSGETNEARSRNGRLPHVLRDSHCNHEFSYRHDDNTNNNDHNNNNDLTGRVEGPIR